MTLPDTVVKNATVVITDNLIESINGSIPKNAEIIDGKGKYLSPGLIDVHIHLYTDVYFGSKLPSQAPGLSFNTEDIMAGILEIGICHQNLN
jgi:imidazolonepropionase-like amidohydrolase